MNSIATARYQLPVPPWTELIAKESLELQACQALDVAVSVIPGQVILEGCTHAKSPSSDKWMTPLNWNHWPWDLCLLTPEMVLSLFQLVGGWFWPLSLNSANHFSNCFGVQHAAFTAPWTLSLQWPSWRLSAFQAFIWDDLAPRQPTSHLCQFSYRAVWPVHKLHAPPDRTDSFHLGFYHPDRHPFTSNPSIENLHHVYNVRFSSFNIHTE